MDIYYYRAQSGLEVDFIILQKNRIKQLIQVSETLIDVKTYKREVKALEQTMAERNLTEGLIITRNEEDKVETESGVVSQAFPNPNKQ